MGKDGSLVEVSYCSGATGSVGPSSDYARRLHRRSFVADEEKPRTRTTKHPCPAPSYTISRPAPTVDRPHKSHLPTSFVPVPAGQCIFGQCISGQLREASLRTSTRLNECFARLLSTGTGQIVGRCAPRCLEIGLEIRIPSRFVESA